LSDVPSPPPARLAWKFSSSDACILQKDDFFIIVVRLMSVGSKMEGGKMAGELAQQFFTMGSLATLAGATGATLVVTNAARQAFGFARAWFGLVVAEVICIGLAIYAGQTGSDFVIAALNGCLVYLGAAGASDAAGGKANEGAVPRGNEALEKPRGWRAFFGSWY
jgi:hypothetical protein